MFEYMAKVQLDEDPDTTADPRHALIVRDPPTPCEVEVAAWLLDRKPRWWERPFWLRSSGIINHPVPGLLRAWVLTASNDRFGVVDLTAGGSDSAEITAPGHRHRLIDRREAVETSRISTRNRALGS